MVSDPNPSRACSLVCNRGGIIRRAYTIRIRAYTLVVNYGFAPCRWRKKPDGRYEETNLLTLANCMADMRGVVKGTEWIAGIAPNGMTNRLAYLMRVDGD